ncbi:MAG: hypothetical protein ACRCWS_00685 [Propionibacteriaceae bacterium]
MVLADPREEVVALAEEEALGLADVEVVSAGDVEAVGDAEVLTLVEEDVAVLVEEEVLDLVDVEVLGREEPSSKPLEQPARPIPIAIHAIVATHCADFFFIKEVCHMTGSPTIDCIDHIDGSPRHQSCQSRELS